MATRKEIMVFTDQELEQINDLIAAMRLFAAAVARRVKLVQAPTARLLRAKNNVGTVAQAMLLQLEHLESNVFSLENSPLRNYPTGEYSTGIRTMDRREVREEASNVIEDSTDGLSLGKLKGKLSCLTVEIDTEDAAVNAASAEPKAARTRPVSREKPKRVTEEDRDEEDWEVVGEGQPDCRHAIF